MRAAALGRADLLRAWAQTEASASDRLAELCGYRALPRTLTLTLDAEESSDVVPDPQLLPDPVEPVDEAAIKPPLRARLFQAWVEERAPAAASTEALEPVSPAELLPADAQAPPRLPLVRTPRLWPALQRSLSKRVPAGLDVPALVRQLALGQRVDPLPLRCEALPATPLLVIWDDAERLRTYEQDYVQILRLIEQLRGRQYTLYTRHAGDWSRWDGPSKSHQHRSPAPPKAGGGIVLLLSDLGALAGTPQVEQQWQQQIQAWRQQGAQPVAWLPTAPGQVAAALARLAAVHHLSTSGGLRAQGQGWRTEAQRTRTQSLMQAASERLLTVAACAVHVAPDLLRALRLVDPTLRPQPAAEGLAWSAATVGSSLLSRALQPAWAPHYRREFGRLDPDLQRQAILAIQQQHASHGRTTPALEWLLWATHAAEAAQSADTAEQVQTARSLLSRLARAGGMELPDEHLRAYARDIVYRLSADANWWQQEGELGGALYQLTDVAQLPAGLDPIHALSRRPAKHRVYLAQRGNGLWLLPEGHVVPAGQRLCEPFAADQVVVERLVGVRTGQMSVTTTFDVGAEPLWLQRQMQPLVVHTPRLLIRINEIPRPGGTFEFGRNGQGVYVRSGALGDLQGRFRALPPDKADPAFAFVHKSLSRPGNAIADEMRPTVIAMDADVGFFAALIVGAASQRFRWIPPGEFWMGSPDAERARIIGQDFAQWSQREAPRHRVQLTHGYWLADTPCTQAFWQALMDSNPSHFNDDPKRPVEQVSWEDVQSALSRLNPLLPDGCTADLPTEAEWEYACRAGTITAFSFGDTLRADQARFLGEDPFGRGGDGDRTVPVASYPANPWGLFDMHGNVWEWCRDGMREYTGAAVVDPEGRVGAARAVRGGSWFSNARRCRSAYRNAVEPDYRHFNLGFRLVLRSTSPVTLPEAASLHAPEAREEARRDAGPTLLDRMFRPKKGKPR